MSSKPREDARYVGSINLRWPSPNHPLLVDAIKSLQEALDQVEPQHQPLAVLVTARGVPCSVEMWRERTPEEIDAERAYAEAVAEQTKRAKETAQKDLKTLDRLISKYPDAASWLLSSKFGFHLRRR